MKVYSVEFENSVIGIFSTREKAQAFVDRFYSEDTISRTWIVCYTVDMRENEKPYLLIPNLSHSLRLSSI